MRLERRRLACNIAASADVSLRLVKSKSFHAFGSRGVAGEAPSFQSHPRLWRLKLYFSNLTFQIWNKKTAAPKGLAVFSRL